MSTLKIGIVAAALSTDPRHAAMRSRAAGFHGLQFDAFSPQLNLPELSITGRREFLHMLALSNQQFIGLRAELGPKGFAPGADIDRLLSQLDRILETTAGLMSEAGPPLLCLDIGVLPEPPPEHRPRTTITREQAGLLILPPITAAPAPEATNLDHIPQKVDPVFAAQVDAVMAELGGLADRYRVFVALRADLSSFAALAQVIRKANCPWFGIDLDPVAMLRDRWSADEIFSLLGSHLRHVRARDANLGLERRTRPAPIGRGDIHWEELLASLDAASYSAWLTFDPTDLPDRPSAAAAGLDFLKRISPGKQSAGP